MPENSKSLFWQNFRGYGRASYTLVSAKRTLRIWDKTNRPTGKQEFAPLPSDKTENLGKPDPEDQEKWHLKGLCDMSFEMHLL